MSPVPEAASTHQAVKNLNKRSTFNIYPILGLVLLVGLAAVMYGGLLIFLLEQ